MAAYAPSGLCPGCLLRTAIEHGSARSLAPLLPKLRYFGDYELVEEVARGGMGVVYRARQVSLDRIVAVKMMRPGVLATEDEIRRFQAEARTAAGMQHPNIVAIHEVGEFDGLHYFSMDFVEGPSLDELARQGPLAPLEAARYVQLLAEAVHYAHGKGILHRDLKPSNVLVDAGGMPRITDFGLARPLEGGSGLTVTGALIGTPAYMPPEQAAGDGAPLSAASDCYSLGAILYELLTGRPPFQGANALATARMVVEQAPASLRSIDPTIDRDLEAICLRCLEKDPARRYETAAELAADLERFLRGEALQAHGASWRRKRWPLAAVAAVLIGSVIVWAMARNTRRAPLTRAVPRYRRPTAPQLLPPPLPPRRLAKPLADARLDCGRDPLHRLASLPLHRRRPAGLSVEPAHGSGNRQAFKFRYSQPEGSAPVAAAEVEFRDVQSDRSCRIFVEPDGEPGVASVQSGKGSGPAGQRQTRCPVE